MLSAWRVHAMLSATQLRYSPSSLAPQACDARCTLMNDAVFAESAIITQDEDMKRELASKSLCRRQDTVVSERSNPGLTGRWLAMGMERLEGSCDEDTKINPFKIVVEISSHD